MDQETAATIALNVMYEESDLVEGDEIVITYMEETEEGWYVECNSRMYLETDDPIYALVAAPLMIHEDGSYRKIF